MDRLRAMQVVVSIADLGSLTAAAQALDSSLPSVVRTLAALETRLSVRLFHRTTRYVSPTEEGRYYIENCRSLLASIRDVESTVSSGAVEPSGQLTITAPVQFGQLYVAPAVTRFVQAYDKVRVKLAMLDRVVNLVEENFDVGIRIGVLEDSSLVTLRVGEVSRLVVASPSYLKRHGVPRHPKDLLRGNCIQFSGGTGPLWSFHEKNKQFNVPVTGNLEFNHIAPAVDACVAGLGFGMFISYQVREQLRQKRLRVVLESFQPPPRPISVIYPHGRKLPARTKVFIDWIRSELKTALGKAETHARKSR